MANGSELDKKKLKGIEEKLGEFDAKALALFQMTANVGSRVDKLINAEFAELKAKVAEIDARLTT